MTNEQKEAIASMRDAGVPFPSIAEQLGLSINTIKSFCKRNNIMSGRITGSNVHFCLQCHKSITQAEHRKTKKFCSDKCR
ncbi:putative uncharacterized protein [Ruminococcus sp. CAG:403]|nr:putative uncharacterized protein [Ruminococcus sp. CAG:403]